MLVCVGFYVWIGHGCESLWLQQLELGFEHGGLWLGHNTGLNLKHQNIHI